MRSISLLVTALIGLMSGAALSAQSVSLPPDLAAIRAPVVYLVDVSNGQVLFEREADRRFVPASVTKVMTLYTAFELIDAGQLAPLHLLPVSPGAWKQWRGKGSTMYLNADTRVPVSDLLLGIANVSANDASYVLAEGAAGSLESWTARMNTRARALGMDNSHFATPNGWPDEGATFTTARDLVTLASALLRDHPAKVASYIGKRQFTYEGITQSNYDPMLGRVRGADGIKTGYTNQAGFTYLGTAKRGDQRLVVVIAGAETQADRGRLARGLIEWGFSSFERRTLFDKGAIVGAAQVQDGNARSLELVADRAVAINTPLDKESAVTMTIAYDGPLRAPISAGETVARLIIDGPNMKPARIPLRAKGAVAKAGFFARIANAFAGWLS